MKMILLAAGFAIATAAPAFADPNCLRLDLVYSWKVLNNKTLIVEDELHQKFKVSLMGWCPGLPYNETLAFDVVGGMRMSCISRGDMVISHEHPMGAFRCPVTDVVRYTPEMEKADKAAADAAKAAQ